MNIQFKNNQLTVFQSSLYMTTSTVIQTNSSIIVVDPTWLPDEVEGIRNYVYRIKKDRQIHLIFTHSDWDHILGVGAFPDAKIIGSKELSEHDQKEKIINQIKEFDDLNYLSRHYPVYYPQVHVEIEGDRQQLIIDELVLTFYKAPGHTADGLFTVIEPYGIFVAGDYLSDVEFPFIYSGFKDYLQTIHKSRKIVSDHDIHVLIPGHGNVTTSKDEINQRIQESIDYLENLKKNIDQEVYLKKRYRFYNGMKSTHANNKKWVNNC
ncbi:MBL fold metallo-hydrolase [Bacillus carboniphilus]|uniref:MBL fold metallo-hydrolase n=1 Tax=Bacillus carboniphilus TaxID=86663 RepID=A0ABY9JTI3_9BACI|nr:MBL fold metallo-hydrolase [Bacillus carboniphilus]WLR42134.1 MBL fold metallo-hydrolase [Bacillus carboniphilus]